MLVVLSIVLAIGALALLVVGLLGDTVGLIALSIVVSAAAAMALVAWGRRAASGPAGSA